MRMSTRVKMGDIRWQLQPETSVSRTDRKTLVGHPPHSGGTVSSITPASMNPTPSTMHLTGTWFHRVGLAPYSYLGLYEQTGPVGDESPQRSAA